MNKYHLSDEEDMRLRFSIMLPSRRSLYEYLCELPIEKLEVFPKKGYHWWMGKACRTPQAIAMREYILHWRIVALDARQRYSGEYLETLSDDELGAFLRSHIQKVPIWAYQEPLQNAVRIRFQREDSRK